MSAGTTVTVYELIPDATPAGPQLQSHSRDAACRAKPVKGEAGFAGRRRRPLSGLARQALITCGIDGEMTPPTRRYALPHLPLIPAKAGTQVFPEAASVSFLARTRL